MKRALITGITGQDGSYLAELLLSKGYEVHGIIRRSSSFNTARIDHIYDRLHLHYGDLTDGGSLRRVLETSDPDEVYNLAAQSHVKVSFDQPEYTVDSIVLGTLRLLEAVRDYDPYLRFYQASSSEMFGNELAPQNEKTRFSPCSPYGISKLAAHDLCVTYREAYGMQISCGILFNHECVAESTPLVVRKSGVIDVCTPIDLISLRRKGSNVQTYDLNEIEIWDGAGWTPLLAITATKRRADCKDHSLLSIHARAGVVDVTAHHGMLTDTREPIRADVLREGSCVALADSMPLAPEWTSVSVELAEFLGYMVADGYVGRGEHGSIQFTKNDKVLSDRVAELWSKLFLGGAKHRLSASGFKPGNFVGQLSLTGARSVASWLREQLYTKGDFKRVPAIILNASIAIQDHFLRAYYAGDGLKAGNGESIKTNSTVLAQGLCWMYAQQNRSCSVYCEHRQGRAYYQLNLLSESPKGVHFRKTPSEIRKVDASTAPDDWVFDLETGSGVFMAGVGRIVVRNSPRRGETFVTRKIAKAAARIAAGKQDKLVLGNLQARRDWGFAGDYVEAMWRMLQDNVAADDFVIATGESHTVEEFVSLAFAKVGLDASKYILEDSKYFRPNEVDDLCGNPDKARRKLGWEPTVQFQDLVNMMLEAECNACT